MRIFISGPMTGYEQYNFPVFDTAEVKLIGLGYNVVNPANICRKYKRETVLTDRTVFDRMIREELDELAGCDAIYLLKGWERSFGARKELAAALEKNLTVVLEPADV